MSRVVRAIVAVPVVLTGAVGVAVMAQDLVRLTESSSK